MKRKRTPRPTDPVLTIESGRTAAPPMPDEPAAFSGIYSGANPSTDRGLIWFPSLDTREELDSFSRDELMRRIRWLCANEGFVKGIPQNAATLVGYQTPQADSGDEAWDELAEQAWRDACLTPEVFDHGGKYDFQDAQLMLKRLRYKDGDCLTVLTEWPRNGRAKVAFYEAHQLRNPERPPSSQNWRDGILLGEGGRHLAYGLWDPSGNTVSVVPARDCIYSGTLDAPGYIRAIPPLAHAVNHAHDITETWALFKKAIKVSSLFGVLREYDVDAQPRSRQGLTGPPATRQTATTDENIEVSKVYEGGQIPRLNPGEKAQIITDDRPHPNVAEFISTLVRDMAVGFGLPPEVLWEMGRLTGPGVRFILDMADRWIKEQQRIDRRWARRVWVYFIAKEIKAGRLPMPSTRTWWRVKFQSQRNLTIDRGKESRARIEELRAGFETWSGWDDVTGSDWKDRIDQRIREVSRAKEKCAAAGLEYTEVFPPAPGSAPANDTASTTDGSDPAAADPADTAP